MTFISMINTISENNFESRKNLYLQHFDSYEQVIFYTQLNLSSLTQLKFLDPHMVNIFENTLGQNVLIS